MSSASHFDLLAQKTFGHILRPDFLSLYTLKQRHLYLELIQALLQVVNREIIYTQLATFHNC